MTPKGLNILQTNKILDVQVIILFLRLCFYFFNKKKVCLAL